MRRIYALLLIVSIGYGCSQNGSKSVKAPTRVKVESVSSSAANSTGLMSELWKRTRPRL